MTEEPEKPKKVVFCTPTMTRPSDPYLAALEASVPLIIAAGWDEACVFEVGCPYISAARATLLRKALDAKADVVVFIDHDLSWDAKDLLTLIETPGDVVAGTYRYKKDEEQYMGAINTDAVGRPIMLSPTTISAYSIPAGFLKITTSTVHRFMEAYPELICGVRFNPGIDLFNHGAHKGIWYGEDMAFSRNWRNLGGEIVLVPDLNLTHHSAEQAYPGNFHQYLLRQPQPEA